MYFLLFICGKINFCLQKNFPSAPLPILFSLLYLGKLGCDSLHYTVNQGRRQSLLSGGPHKFTVGKLISSKLKKKFTCNQQDKILGQKKGPSSLSILSGKLQGQPYSFSVSTTVSALPQHFWLKSLL